MKFTVEYPVSQSGYAPELVTNAGMRAVAIAVERAGFDALAFTEHPAPSAKWMNNGGHDSLDVVAALSFCAAVTERVTLMPYAMVLPFYNPFYAAKLLTTLDLISDQRLLLVAGTGYLRSEFLALGVDMDERNARFDEAMDVMKGAWTEIPFHHDGPHFRSLGVAQRPMPGRVPPVLIGGNGRLARRRAARYQGWSPMIIDDRTSATVRTPALPGIPELAAGIREVRDLAGDAPMEFQIQTYHTRFMHGGLSVEAHRDHLGQLSDAGVTRFVLQAPGCPAADLADVLGQYGETFGLLEAAP
jgi:probable F420-dependent oxidoreductase